MYVHLAAQPPAVVWGVASLPLSEVVACPGTWGERQQLQLHGHRLAGKGATLEVQLFLSTVRACCIRVVVFVFR